MQHHGVLVGVDLGGASANATSGDINVALVLSAVGTAAAARVWVVLAVLVLLLLCMVLNMLNGLGLAYPCCPDVEFMLMAFRRFVDAVWKNVLILAYIVVFY